MAETRPFAAEMVKSVHLKSRATVVKFFTFWFFRYIFFTLKILKNRFHILNLQIFGHFMHLKAISNFPKISKKFNCSKFLAAPLLDIDQNVLIKGTSVACTATGEICGNFKMCKIGVDVQVLRTKQVWYPYLAENFDF